MLNLAYKLPLLVSCMHVGYSHGKVRFVLPAIVLQIIIWYSVQSLSTLNLSDTITKCCIIAMFITDDL